MKKILTFILTCFAIQISTAQLETPKPSPLSKIEQKVGLTNCILEYSRPSVKGRTVFGDLVPYGKLWRTGANKNSKITFDTKFTIDNVTLDAGTYAIYTKPGKTLWEILFYSKADNSGLPKTWEEDKVVLMTSVNVKTLPYSTETFFMGFNKLTNSGAVLEIIWEKTMVELPFTVPTDDAVLRSINDVMNKNPEAMDYYKSAVYYLEENKNMKQAKIWIDKAVESYAETPTFWMLRRQSLIYSKLGLQKEAIAIAKKSLELAEKAGNLDYVKMNQDSISAWEEM